MGFIYFSHSYRNEDAPFVRYFSQLMISEGLIQGIDPPSNTLNTAKLERNIRSSDAMVAVLNWREEGISKYILFEIALCLRACKPLLVFVEDTLPDNIIPSCVLHRRFSRRSFLSQIREHKHAFQMLKSYIGEPPPPKYQPFITNKSCLLVGLADLPRSTSEFISGWIEARGYSVVNPDYHTPFYVRDLAKYRAFSSIELSLCFIDSNTQQSQYLFGAIYAAFIPSITFTANDSYEQHLDVPKEFRPQFVNLEVKESIQQTLEKELNLYEESFIEIDNKNQVEKYVSLLIETDSRNGRYEANNQQLFKKEVRMGDTYNIFGQTGAIGPGSHAHDITFNQIWNKLQSKPEYSLEIFSEQLSNLFETMKKQATKPEEKAETEVVEKAIETIKKGDGPKTIKWLKHASNFALKIAKDIGAFLVVCAIESTLSDLH